MLATSSKMSTMLLTIDIRATCLISTAARLAPFIIIITIKRTFVLYDNVYL
jgi:hypothetical protein